MISKVENNNLRQSYTGIKPSAKRQQNRAVQPNFTGAGSALEKEIREALPQARALNIMKKWEYLKGEMGGILITALGTGFVAPIFIGYNPFVKPPKNATPEEKKENENTKLYTAMRQPISAALAIIFQASVQKYIDKGLDFVVNNKKISSLADLHVDQQELNTKTFIQDNVKKAMKNEGKTKPSWFKALFSSDAREQRKAFAEELDSRVSATQDAQLEKVAQKFQETGKINIGERHLDFKSTANLVNDQIDAYIKDAQGLQKTGEKMAFYLDRADVLVPNENKFIEMFSGIKKENVTAEIQKLLENVTADIQKLSVNEKDAKAAKVAKGIKEILEEILKKKTPEEQYSRVQRTLQRIERIKKMCKDVGDGTFSRDNYREALLNRNKVLSDRIVELTAAKIGDVKNAKSEDVVAAIEKMVKQCSFEDVDGIARDVLMDTETFDKDIAKLTKKVYKDIAKGYKGLVENAYKGVNQFTKIGVGVLITLPITCTALNWVYPRFMDLFFPELSGAKEAKKPEQNNKVGGDK